MSKKAFAQSAEALGGTIELRLVVKDIHQAEKLFIPLWKEIHLFEERFSRFKPQSELNRFNSDAGTKTHISPEFHDLLIAAYHYADLTQGLFNPFILPNLQKAGYKSSMTSPSTEAIDYSDRMLTPHTSLEIGENWAKIPARTSLDMGGIGKGYLADRLTNLLENKVLDYCLSLSGDIRVSGEDENGPWRIDVQSRKDDSKNIGYYTGDSTPYGIATSGTVRTKLGHNQNHLIDPRTGEIVTSPNNICTVAAKKTTSADVLASTILITGEDYKNLIEDMLAQGIINAVLLQKEETSSPILFGSGFSITK